MKKKTYLPEMDLLRAAAIIAVVITHVTAAPVTSLSSESSFYLIYLTLNNFGKLGVPTFIFASGFMLYYANDSRTENRGYLKAFYRSKFLYIVLPYLAWSLFYHLFYTGFDGLAFIKQLILGKASYHLYFMIIIIQFYLIFPCLLKLIKKYQFIARYYFLLGLVIQWSYYFFNRYFWQFEYKSRVSLTYLSLFVFGILVASNYDKLVDIFKKRAVLMLSFAAWTAALLWNTILFCNVYTGRFYANGAWFELAWNAFAFLSIIFLCSVANCVSEKIHRSIVKVMLILGQVSFGIYLIHPFIINLWRKIPFSPSPIVYHSGLILQFIVVLFGSVTIIYFLQKYIPLTDYIVGKSRIRIGK